MTGGDWRAIQVREQRLRPERVEGTEGTLNSSGSWISAWGGGGSLADYANRTLAGMVSSYYKYRWEIFIRFLKDALVRHTAFDTDTYKRELVVLE